MTNLVEARRFVRRRARATRTSDRDAFALGGGLNLVDPNLTVLPGYARDGSLNYEMGIDGGYRLLDGFESAFADDPPGSGQISGVYASDSKLYAARFFGSGEERIYQHTGGTWTALTVLAVLELKDITAEGVTAFQSDIIGAFSIAGTTSGATAGMNFASMYDDGNGGIKGTLSISSVTGTFQVGETVHGVAPGDTSVYGTIESIDLAPAITGHVTNSHYRWDELHSGSLKTSVVAVNNVDGRLIVISNDDKVSLLTFNTGFGSAAPNLIRLFKEHLFVGISFPDGAAFSSTLMHSGLGEPLDFRAAAGANAYQMDTRLTGLLPAVDTLFIFERRRTWTFVGTSIDDFQLAPYSSTQGAVERSLQEAGFGVHLGDASFLTLLTTDRFGNFNPRHLSRLIQPLIPELEAVGVTASVVNRERGIYRCFFADGRFVSIAFDGEKPIGHMLCNYGVTVTAAASTFASDGSHKLYFGTSDGKVFKADEGLGTFDGENITATLVLPYHFSGLASRIKRYRIGRVEAVLNGGASATPLTVTIRLDEGARTMGPFDISGVTEFQRFKIDTNAENLSLQFDYDGSVAPHTLRAVALQEAVRRLNRSVG